MLDRKALGERLLQWHSSGGDPIYAVGSYFIESMKHPDKAVVKEAIVNLAQSCDAFERMLRGEVVMVSRPDRGLNGELLHTTRRVSLRAFAGYKVSEMKSNVRDLKEIVASLKEYLALDFARGKPKLYQATAPERKVLRGRLYFESRVRRVEGDKVNDRVVTITGVTDMEVAQAAKGAAARLSRDAR